MKFLKPRAYKQDFTVPYTIYSLNFRTKKQVKERIDALSSSNAPSAPPKVQAHRSCPDGAVSNGVEHEMLATHGGNWEDVKELMVIENGKNT